MSGKRLIKMESFENQVTRRISSTESNRGYSTTVDNNTNNTNNSSSSSSTRVAHQYNHPHVQPHQQQRRAPSQPYYKQSQSQITSRLTTNLRLQGTNTSTSTNTSNSVPNPLSPPHTSHKRNIPYHTNPITTVTTNTTTDSLENNEIRLMRAEIARLNKQVNSLNAEKSHLKQKSEDADTRVIELEKILSKTLKEKIFNDEVMRRMSKLEEKFTEQQQSQQHVTAMSTAIVPVSQQQKQLQQQATASLEPDAVTPDLLNKMERRIQDKIEKSASKKIRLMIESIAEEHDQKIKQVEETLKKSLADVDTQNINKEKFFMSEIQNQVNKVQQDLEAKQQKQFEYLEKELKKTTNVAASARLAAQQQQRSSPSMESEISELKKLCSFNTKQIKTLDTSIGKASNQISELKQQLFQQGNSCQNQNPNVSNSKLENMVQNAVANVSSDLFAMMNTKIEERFLECEDGLKQTRMQQHGEQRQHRIAQQQQREQPRPFDSNNSSSSNVRRGDQLQQSMNDQEQRIDEQVSQNRNKRTYAEIKKEQMAERNHHYGPAEALEESSIDSVGMECPSFETSPQKQQQPQKEEEENASSALVPYRSNANNESAARTKRRKMKALNNYKTIQLTNEWNLCQSGIIHAPIFFFYENTQLLAFINHDNIHLVCPHDQTKVAMWKVDARKICKMTLDGIDALASGGKDNKISFWSLRDFSSLATFSCAYEVRDFNMYNYMGRNLFVCETKENIIELWDLNTREKIRSVEINEKYEKSKIFVCSGDGEIYVAYFVSNGDGVKIINLLQDDHPVKILCERAGNVRDICTFEYGGETIIAIGAETKNKGNVDWKRKSYINLWKMSDCTVLYTFYDGLFTIHNMKPFLSRGKVMLMSTSCDRDNSGRIYIWALGIKKLVHQIQHKKCFFSVHLCENVDNEHSSVIYALNHNSVFSLHEVVQNYGNGNGPAPSNNKRARIMPPQQQQNDPLQRGVKWW